jgi:uncharacterized protein YdaU (DUF1376 family)
MSRAWMPLYIGDYQRDTKHLTTTQHGAYLLLLMFYWNQGPPPDDPALLRRVTALSRDQWRRHWPVLQKFFHLATLQTSSSWQGVPRLAEPGAKVWRHKRLDAEIEKAEILKAKRQIAGMKGGLTSRGQTNIQRFVKSKC